jgi:hypothetical protein
METLSYGVMFTGIAILFIGFMWSVGVIFTENPFLAVVCLFVPLACLYVMSNRLPERWRPFTVFVSGIVLMTTGMIMVAEYRR